MTTPPPPYGAYPPPPGAYAGYYGYPRLSAAAADQALAIVSLVCAFLFAPLGIIFGHISLSQIKRPARRAAGWPSRGWSSAT